MANEARLYVRRVGGILATLLPNLKYVLDGMQGVERIKVHHALEILKTRSTRSDVTRVLTYLRDITLEEAGNFFAGITIKDGCMRLRNALTDLISLDDYKEHVGPALANIAKLEESAPQPPVIPPPITPPPSISIAEPTLKELLIYRAGYDPKGGGPLAEAGVWKGAAKKAIQSKLLSIDSIKEYLRSDDYHDYRVRIGVVKTIKDQKPETIEGKPASEYLGEMLVSEKNQEVISAIIEALKFAYPDRAMEIFASTVQRLKQQTEAKGGAPEKELEQARQEIARLEKELEQLRLSQRDSATSTPVVVSQLDYQEELQTLSKQLAQLTEEIRILQDEINRSQEEKSRLTTQEDEAREKLTEAQRKAKGHEEKIRKLASEYDQRRGEIEAELASLREQLAQLQTTPVEPLYTKEQRQLIATLESSTFILPDGPAKQLISDQIQQIHEAARQRAVDEKTLALQKQIEEKEREKEQAETQYTQSIIEASKNIDPPYPTLQGQIQALTETLAQLTERLKQLNDHIAKLNQRLANLEQQKEVVHQRVNGIQEELTTHAQAIKAQLDFAQRILNGENA